jgi:hypothetical protein
MGLVTNKEKLRDMITQDSIRGKALWLLLNNGPMTGDQLADALDVPRKSLVSNMNTIIQDASYISLKVTKNSEKRNVFELIGLHKPMRDFRTKDGKDSQPLGQLESKFFEAFSLMGV